MTDCIFCRIIAGEIPGDFVVVDEDVVAFRDISPKAPTHVLVVPRVHAANVAELAETAPQTLAAMAKVAQKIADDEAGGHFRWIFNTGERAGQTVFHVHGHVIAGAELGWDPA